MRQMLIKITYPNGAVQQETAFESIAEAAKALFTHVPEGVKIEVAGAVVTEAPAVVEEVVEKPVAKKKSAAK